MKTFYFNTGVTPNNRTLLCEGQIWKNGTMQMPFDVPDEVPDNAILLGLSSNEDAFKYANYRVEVSNTAMLSKYAFFK